jgi:sulfopyruvate decarboxylase subunit beta
MLGSMGLASSIGLGLALARPERKVMVLDGDGSVLMNLGTLATIAHHAPENYLLVILDNCCYGSTGSQPTCTFLGTDLFALAKAAGVKDVKKVDKDGDLPGALLGRGVVIAKVDAGNANVPIISLSPEEIIERLKMRSTGSAILNERSIISLQIFRQLRPAADPIGAAPRG